MMRFVLPLFFVAIAGLTVLAQPLQFIDKNDSLKGIAIDVAGDDFGSWFAAITGADSSLQLIQFNYCGEVEQSHVVNLPQGLRFSQVKVVHLGDRKYLIAATVHSGGLSRIMVFHSFNANFTDAKFIGEGTSTEHKTPLVSVLDRQNVLLGFQYRNAQNNFSSRVVLMDSMLNAKWTRHLSDTSDLRWILMSEKDAFYVGDKQSVKKYDTAGVNLWSRYFPSQSMSYQSALKWDTLVVFATDYIDPIPDTGVVKRPKYKQVIALEDNGDYEWESNRIRALQLSGLVNPYTGHLFFDGNQQPVLQALDTVKANQVPVVVSHKINSLGKVYESIYFSPEDSVRDFAAGLINDGNVGICAVLGNRTQSKGALNIKAATQLNVCDSAKFNFLQNAFITMQESSLSDAKSATLTTQPTNFRAEPDSIVFLRLCEKFDLNDSEIPEVLCKGDSVFLAGIQIPNARYEWSNGGKQAGTWVKEAGRYSVKIEYCGKEAIITYIVSYRTFQDIVFNIEECNYPRRLFANQFENSRYKWQTGDTTSAIDVNGPGTYNVTVTKCEVDFKITFNVALPKFPNQIFDFNVCSYPDTLYPFQRMGATYVWEDGSTKGFRQITNPGTYKVTISYCQSSFTNTFNISLLSDASKFVSDSCNAFPIPLAVVKPKGSESVLWSTGQTTDTIQAPRPGIYSAQVGDCIQNFTVGVKEEKILHFPNVFVPGSQVKENTVFKPYFKDVSTITTYQLVVMNRWGQKVFETNKLDTGWDGILDGNPAPVDTYTYYAIYERNSCVDRSHLKGSVTLIR